MTPELAELLDQFRRLSKIGSRPYITVRVEGTAGGRGVLAIDRKVLVEMLDLLSAAPRPAGEGRVG